MEWRCGVRWQFPDDWYVTPVRARQPRDQWGTPVPGTWEREELPRALFAPGVSSEEQMLSDVVQHRAQLFFQSNVDVESTDHIEVPDQGRWSIRGNPNHWPMGTVLTLENPS